LWWLWLGIADSNSGCSFRWAKQQTQLSTRRQFLALGLTALLGTVLVFYPHFLKFPNSNYIVGKAPALYEFSGATKSILIASLSSEADNLPIFSRDLSWWAGNMQFYHVSYDRQFANELLIWFALSTLRIWRQWKFHSDVWGRFFHAGARVYTWIYQYQSLVYTVAADSEDMQCWSRDYLL